MADGAGGLIANLMMGNPMGQLNQALAGPSASPQAAASGQGGQGQPGSNQMPQQPAMAQPQATQPPPDLARLYLQLEQSHQMAEGFNRGLATFLGGFKGPPGGAEQIMRGMTGGQSQDPGVMLQNLLQMRQQQAMMNAPAPPGVNPALLECSCRQTQRAKVAGDIITQQAGIGGPPVIQEMQRAKMQYMKDNGITDPNDPKIPRKYTYPDEFNAASTAEGKAASDVAEFKDSAVQDYATVDKKTEKSLATVNQLLGNMPDTMTAMTTFAPTTGKLAANMPSLGGYNPLAASQTVKEQANAINVLKGELSSEAMSGVKNIRTQKEFGAITAALTAALDPANSPEKVQAALETIKGQLLRTRAIATAAAGHKLTGDLVGQLGPDEKTFLDPSSPYYNGATQEAPPKGEAPAQSGEGPKPLPDATAQAIKQKLASSPGERDALLKHFQDLGYDVSKF